MKQVTFKNEGGGYRVVDVQGDKENNTWGKINGQFIYNFQFRGVCADIKKDKFKIVIQ